MAVALIEEAHDRYAPRSLYHLWSVAARQVPAQAFAAEVAGRWERSAERMLEQLTDAVEPLRWPDRSGEIRVVRGSRSAAEGSGDVVPFDLDDPSGGADAQRGESGPSRGFSRQVQSPARPTGRRKGPDDAPAVSRLGDRSGAQILRDPPVSADRVDPVPTTGAGSRTRRAAAGPAEPDDRPRRGAESRERPPDGGGSRGVPGSPEDPRPERRRERRVAPWDSAGARSPQPGRERQEESPVGDGAHTLPPSSLAAPPLRSPGPLREPDPVASRRLEQQLHDALSEWEESGF